MGIRQEVVDGRREVGVVGKGCRGKGRSCADGVGVAWGRREVSGGGQGCGRRGRRCGDLVVVAGEAARWEGCRRVVGLGVRVSLEVAACRPSPLLALIRRLWSGVLFKNKLMRSYRRYIHENILFSQYI